MPKPKIASTVFLYFPRQFVQTQATRKVWEFRNKKQPKFASTAYLPRYVIWVAGARVAPLVPPLESRAPALRARRGLASRVARTKLPAFAAPRTPLGVWAGGARRARAEGTACGSCEMCGMRRRATRDNLGECESRTKMSSCHLCARKPEISHDAFFTLSHMFRFCVARKNQSRGHSDSAGSGETKPSSADARARVCELLSIVASGRSASATCWR